MDYQLLKLIHILSATIMIGTGLGSAFYLYFTYKLTKDKSEITILKSVLSLVILADKIFTSPSVIIQLITGILLSNKLNITYTNWFYLVITLSLLILVLWLKAVFIQLKFKKILEANGKITIEFDRLMKIWFYIGIPSFLGAIYLYYLMVYKPFL